MYKSEKFWDRAAKKADKGFNQLDESYSKLVEVIGKYLNSTDIVMDFACGTGKITLAIAGSVKTVQAIDISAKMLDVAKNKAAQRNITNIEFVQSNLFDPQHKPASLDVIIASGVLHLLEDSEQVMDKIDQLLKPGGLFISATGCLGEKTTALSFIARLLTKIKLLPYIRFFTIADLKALITKADFQIVERQLLDAKVTNYLVVAKKRAKNRP
ncbi:MAG: class I SAM-dependent methyltransferase [Algicola sp.]|nr:class I SAM-dependent methyltransferase [Algicola sp.]